MEKKAKLTIIIICLNLILYWSPLADENRVLIELHGPDEILTGSMFYLSVNVTNISSFDAANFDVIFNEKYLTVIEVYNGNINGKTIPVSMWDIIKKDTLRVILNLPGINGVSGNGTLATIKFKTLSPGTVIINLTNVVLANIDSNQIPCDLIIGHKIKILSKNDGNSDHSDPPDTNIKPIANSSIIPYPTGIIGEPIFFSGIYSYDPDGYITSYHWDFGDGTTGNQSNTTHIYNNSGSYKVTLTVEDNNQTQDNCERMIHINANPINKAPTPPIVNGPFNGTVGISYNFTIQSYDSNNDSIQYQIYWNNDTNNLTTSEFIENGKPFIINHTWTSAGKVTITAISTDGHITSEPTQKTIYIDTIVIETIGYLIDYNTDGIYDHFINMTTNKKNRVKYEDNLYYIDDNNDSQWDYYLSNKSDLIKITTQQKKDVPYLEIIFIFLSIASITFIKYNKKLKR